MKCSIVPMNRSHFETIKYNLTEDYDSFWNESILEGELNNPNSKYFVAIDDNSCILGFGGIWKAVDDCHITDIVVKKDKRSLGIGSSILERLIQEAKQANVNSLTLEVNINNIPAQKLYEKYSFKRLGIRKKYYNNTDDAIIMTLYF